MAADIAEPPQRCGQTQLERRFAGADEPRERHAGVFVLPFEALEPLALCGTAELGLRPLGELGEEGCVCAPDRLQLVLGQQLAGVLAHGLEQREPRAGTEFALQQALVDERAQPVELGSADGFGSLERAAAREDGERGEVAPLAGLQELGAPFEGRTERLLSRGQVTRADTEDGQPSVEPLAQARGREHARPRSGELDCERQAVEPTADRPQGLLVLRAAAEVGLERTRTRDEQLERIVLRKRLHRVHLLARQMENRTAGHDDPQPRRRCKQPHELRAGGEQVLEAVEHDEKLARPQPARQRLRRRLARSLGDAEALHDRREEERVVAERREVDENRAVGERRCRGAREREREPRLPAAPGTGQGQETRVVLADEPPELCELALAPDQRVRRGRQLRDRRRCGRSECRIVTEDRAFQVPQLDPGLQAELVAERRVARAVDLERIHLAAVPVQGEHQLGARALAEGMLRDERPQFREGGLVATGGHLRREPLFLRDEPELVEPHRLCPREALVRDVGECGSAPQRERASEQRGGERRVAVDERRAALLEPVLEPRRVELPLPDLECVPRRDGRDPGLGQGLA